MCFINLKEILKLKRIELRREDVCFGDIVFRKRWKDSSLDDVKSLAKKNLKENKIERLRNLLEF